MFYGIYRNAFIKFVLFVYFSLDFYNGCVILKSAHVDQKRKERVEIT
jgi:hypothetical protein